jgi:hypothetical protein
MSGTVLRELVKVVSANRTYTARNLWPEMAGIDQGIVEEYLSLYSSERLVRLKSGLPENLRKRAPRLQYGRGIRPFFY